MAKPVTKAQMHNATMAEAAWPKPAAKLRRARASGHDMLLLECATEKPFIQKTQCPACNHARANRRSYTKTGPPLGTMTPLLMESIMSMSDRDGFIWYDGKIVPWRDATTHVLTHSLHYGLAVFEGERAYNTDIGTAVFR